MSNTVFKVTLFTGEGNPINFTLETRSILTATRVFPKILETYGKGNWTRTAGETKIQGKGLMAEYQDDQGSIVLAKIEPEVVV